MNRRHSSSCHGKATHCTATGSPTLPRKACGTNRGGEGRGTSRGRDGDARAPGEPGATHLCQGPVPPVLEVPLVALQLLLVLVRHHRDGDHTGGEVQGVVEHGVADCHWGRGGARSASPPQGKPLPPSVYTSFQLTGHLHWELKGCGMGTCPLAPTCTKRVVLGVPHGLGLQLPQEPSSSHCWPVPWGCEGRRRNASHRYWWSAAAGAHWRQRCPVGSPT